MKNTPLFRSFYLAVLLFTSTFVFTSCDSSDTEEPFSLSGKGVFIVNEGNFGTPNGSVSFYHKASSHFENDIFSKNNDDQLLGDVVQSMTLFEDHAYIVANNSNKIEVVEKQTFKSVGTIQGLKSPRYFAALNHNKGYVTEWVAFGGNGRVSVINLETNTVIKTIPVGAMPEQLILANGKLYVANSGGNTVSVINTATDVVENTFETPDSPSEFVQDKNNHIWVLCSGKVVYTDDWSAIDYTKTTPGALAKLNTTANAIETTYTFPSNQSIPKNLSVNGAGDKLYYTYLGKTYSQAVTATQLTSTVVLGRSFYGMEVDPETGNIYGSDNNNFSSDGTVFIYSPTGTKLQEFKAGIGPNGFVFN
ncbi:YncE family protein [Pontibacter fetidus]|uniref:YncE family protein n=1 Tax=Pontibacter fetidus TaxID=2700082 RepID=A0A6B2H9C6_9BACT|nr:YncE family protein [Pontibacter fetidus]NDK56112.1 YncE family protein [Pontibacter fetidus]